MRLLLNLFKLAWIMIVNKVHRARYGYPSKDNIARLVLANDLSPLSNAQSKIIDLYLSDLNIDEISQKMGFSRYRTIKLLNRIEIDLTQRAGIKNETNTKG